ncbi:cellulosome protein [Streptomyces sp. PSKA54]|uniref:Cellulosome protein n=1 Tax=Streptomyces himalayensis subsp. aureolus TaxID=2758039 RepID=A0A7W2D7D5_9ACTN|nr:CBM35 domain-containing protein [Streptomyces himalayensis]MBA4865825.1 cellulosome protein [Streptomyces himalayensis subsp. aureolus]
MAGTLPAAPSARAAAAQTITVDLGAPEGEVMLGANGALYGLGDDGVPSDAALAPLKLTSISQKPDGGLQHPNGDAIAVSKSFFRNGGGDVNVMMQDIYQKWPYEDLGLADYLTKVDSIVEKVNAAEHSDRFVYVPFNEPDWIWYGLNTKDPAAYEKNRDRFLADWKTVYQRIRSQDPDARIAGPNEAYYDKRLLPDFLTFAKANDVLPDVMTWHELSPDSLRYFQSNYDHYRALEKSLGISPLPVNIDEYANRRDLAVPGQLVQWVSMFERNKVLANQAYWDAAGNLSGNVVRTNIPNGGWWLFRWYAGMTGQTVKVTPPSPNAIDTLQGLASLDTSRKQAQVLVGGASGDADVAMQHVDPKVFGTSVTATVAEAAWSGYEGQHASPRVLSRTKVSVGSDGSVTVPLKGMKKMSAYRIVLTPAGSGTPAAATVPWSASYEAEDAQITGGQVYTQGTVANANGYAASGTKDVGSLNTESSKVDFTVTVPSTGTYDLSILYGNQSGAPSTQKLSVDGGPATTVTYPSTENWTYRAKKDLTVDLTAGTHTLTLAHDTAEVTLDRIDLTAHVVPSTSYEATLADVSGNVSNVSYDYGDSSGTGTGALVLGSGGKAVFDVYAPRDGYFTVTSRASAAVQLSLHGETVAAAPNRALKLYLVAGNNRITATGQAALRSLDVTGSGSTSGTLTYEGAQAKLAGGARLVDSAYASSGTYIGWLGNSASSTATFTVDAPRTGKYVLVVQYSHNDRRDNGHAYNTDIMSRTADITVGGRTQTVTFKNTWSWDDYWTLGVPVELKEGSNSVTFGNASAWAPNIDRIQVAAVRG